MKQIEKLVEFDDSQYPDLLAVNGILLDDCEGQRVAIGKGFDYENAYDFMAAFVDAYGSDELAQCMGLDNGSQLFRQAFNSKTFDPTEALTNEIMNDFDGKFADEYPDYEFDYDRNEAKLEADDEKYSRAAGD